MPTTAISSGWSSGELYFYETAVGRSTTGDLLKIGKSRIAIGNSAQDVDLKIFLGSTTEFVLFDAGNSRVDFGADGKGVDVRLFGETASSYWMWDQSLDSMLIAGGSMVVDGLAASKATVTTDSTAGPLTITAAMIVGSYLKRDPAGGNRTDTTDTAANIVAAVDNAQVGSSWLFIYKNTANGAETVTLAGGTGVTLDVASAEIDQNYTALFLVICTNVTGSSEAVTLHKLGEFTHVA